MFASFTRNGDLSGCTSRLSRWLATGNSTLESRRAIFVATAGNDWHADKALYVRHYIKTLCLADVAVTQEAKVWTGSLNGVEIEVLGFLIRRVQARPKYTCFTVQTTVLCTSLTLTAKSQLLLRNRPQAYKVNQMNTSCCQTLGMRLLACGRRLVSLCHDLFKQ